MPLKIYAYLDYVPEMDYSGETKLLLYWREMHLKFGHEPIVLKPYHAQLHPQFKEYDEYVRSLPSVNPARYEAACFHRWAALVAVGGGIMTDFDVIPYQNLEKVVDKKPDRLHGYQMHAPGFIQGRQQDFQAFMDYVLAGGHKPENFNGKSHFSDQYCFAAYNDPDKVKKTQEILNYGEPDWDKAPMTHYPHVATVGLRPRWQHVPNLRAA